MIGNIYIQECKDNLNMIETFSLYQERKSVSVFFSIEENKSGEL